MNKKQQLKKGIIVAAGVLLLVLVTLFATRNLIIQNYANKRLLSFEQKYSLRIHYNDLRMEGLNGLHIEGLSVIPLNCDTFLKAGSIEVQFDFARLLLLKADVKTVTMHGLQVDFIKKDSINSNFDFIFKANDTAPKASNKDSEDVKQNESAHFGENIRQTFNLLFSVLPSNGYLHDFKVSYQALVTGYL